MIKQKSFGNERSDLVVEVYPTGYIILVQGEDQICLGAPPNERFKLLSSAIDYAIEENDKRGK